MKIYLEKDNKSIDITFSGKVSALLKKIKVNPETVIIVKNNELVTEKDVLNNNDSIKILSVISGG